MSSSKLPLVVLAVTLAMSPPAAARALATGDLFQQVFGSSSTKTVSAPITVPVVLDNVRLGEAEIVFDKDPTETAIDGEAFLEAVAELVTPPVLQALDAGAADGFLTFAEIADAGLAADFNDATLELELTVPMDLRQAVTIRGSGTGRAEDAARGIEPAAFSGYTNMFASARYDHLTATLDPGMGLDGAIQLDGVVFEYDSFIALAPRFEPERRNMRLVRSEIETLQTLQAGDLVQGIIGRQRRRSMLGVGIDYDLGLDPTRIVTPAGRREFILERPATVDIYVNGVRRQTLRLPANRYGLEDLPLSSGTNDVRVVATDDAGRTEVFEFNYYFDRQLLREGESLWSANLGLVAADGARVNSFDRRVGVSSFYLRGLSETLTAGVYAQGDRDQQIVGAPFTWTNSYGRFGFDVATSVDHRAGAGLSLAADWSHYDARAESRKADRRWTLGFDWRSASYREWGEQTGNAIDLDIFGAFGQRLGERTYVKLSAAQRHRVDGGASEYGLGATLTHRLFGGVTLSLTGNANLADTNEFTGILSLSIPLGNHRRGRTTFNSKQNQFTASFDHYAADGSWHARVEQRSGNGKPEADARFEFAANKLRGDVRHGRVFNDDDEGGVSTVNLSSAIAFADGYVGISRPIADSFAIVVPHDSIADSFIGVNPAQGGWDAASGPGPAVLSDLRSFETTELAIEAPDVAANVDMGEDHPAVYAGYRTGTVVPIGAEPTVAVRGRLLDGDGEPVALEVGRLEAPADAQIFTNRNGVFVATGLAEGAYRLSVSGRRYGFAVEAVKPGILELGDLDPQ